MFLSHLTVRLKGSIVYGFRDEETLSAHVTSRVEWVDAEISPRAKDERGPSFPAWTKISSCKRGKWLHGKCRRVSLVATLELLISLHSNWLCCSIFWKRLRFGVVVPFLFSTISILLRLRSLLYEKIAASVTLLKRVYLCCWGLLSFCTLDHREVFTHFLIAEVEDSSKKIKSYPTLVQNHVPKYLLWW